MIISTKNLPEELKRLRTETGLSQNDLAIISWVNMHTISRIERDLSSPTTRILEKIIQAIVEAQPKNEEKILLSFDRQE